MRKTTSKSGFTIVELLVVIGIIGVVVVLMLPGKGGAARKTDCVNRVRQLALATHMHHNTHSISEAI